MEQEHKLSIAKTRSLIMADLVFRSPLWAMLILLIYGLIMGGAIWFLLRVVKPSVDEKIKTKHSAVQKEINNVTCTWYRTYAFCGHADGTT
jgi:hypothetical protein